MGTASSDNTIASKAILILRNFYISFSPRSRFAHGCWLMPHQGQGQGDGVEQREEERGAVNWILFLSVWCKLPRCKLQCKMQALKPSTHMLGREAWSGGGASCGVADLSPFLLADLSLFFPFLQCHPHCHFQKSLQITQKCISNFTRSPGIAGAVAPADFQEIRTNTLFIPAPGREVLNWLTHIMKPMSETYS